MNTKKEGKSFLPEFFQIFCVFEMHLGCPVQFVIAEFPDKPFGEGIRIRTEIEPGPAERHTQERRDIDRPPGDAVGTVRNH